MPIKENSPRVATFKLAAALDKYELDVLAFAATWRDPDLFKRLQEQFSELRVLCASLPRLSVGWVAVLVSRVRLLQTLCGKTGPAALALQEHLQAVEGLRKRCLQAMLC